LYYDHERAGPQQQNINVTHPTTGSAYGRFLAASFPSNYREYAVFADLTYRVTDRFDVQVGGREGWQRVAVDAISDTGPFNILVLGAPTADPLVTPSISSNDQAFTYLLTPRYKLSDDRMLYARFASGYRPGGPNTTPGEPPKYAPDKTQNYELGFKGEFLERTVALDASLYYIKWTNIQLNLIDPLTTFGYTGNAGDAKSQGVELSGQWRPLSGLSVAAWVAYDDAVLTSWPAGAQAAYEAGTGPFAYSGARLPLSPRVSANFSLEQKFKLAAGLTASLGGAVSYVGDREGVFAFTPQRQYLPAYSKVDFTAALDWQQWHANLYVNNAFDRGGLISGGLGTDLPYSFYFMQPRLVGLSLAWQF
jgi:outer membrane receptor protein involved in Fe transport